MSPFIGSPSTSATSKSDVVLDVKKTNSVTMNKRKKEGREEQINEHKRKSKTLGDVSRQDRPLSNPRKSNEELKIRFPTKLPPINPEENSKKKAQKEKI
ncbi:hypothetical protein KUTeg_006098 [Tegillarca granosa]|uniref:Uncharacterized protein n=1 Tax=Tegillarca granosa TaxID=220873 RepID=A0ABQ9FFK9_TEGGR|nr:hypothetical protein KUTeg_006098 [Tegillarca granosa]